MKANKLKALLFIFLASLVLFTGCSATKTAKVTQAPAKDTSWIFHDIVDVQFVAEHVKMPKPANVLIVDSRPEKAKFNKGYIPTAINIPDSQFAKMTDKLPKDKNTLLIFYCQGAT